MATNTTLRVRSDIEHRTPTRLPALASAALVAGSLAAAVGMWLHLPGMPEDQTVRAIAEGKAVWLASHMLSYAGLTLAALGLGTATLLARGRGAVPTAIGAVVAAVGAAMMGLVDVLHGTLGWALAGQVDPAVSLAVHEAYFASPAFGAVNALTMLLPLGMIVLGAGLLRSRAVHPALAVVVVLTPIAVFVAFGAGLPTALHGVPMVAGMSVVAHAVYRTRRAGDEIG